jgi:hypothetical protein
MRERFGGGAGAGARRGGSVDKREYGTAKKRGGTGRAKKRNSARDYQTFTFVKRKNDRKNIRRHSYPRA